ncbi:unnamed protein product [Blepharisma stoltei]|uniref:Uncharacterized protein n=1 Tax=Blepharisma stoltei TaxID=1481888 RepID=A0AAU9K5X2_9CILI|nr:unnamed protein product [Blepharisma stoltei]
MISCVMFCEFHIKRGPALVYQYPENYLSKDTFDSLSDILIPRPELCGKVISVQVVGDEYIIGQPVIIVNDKYERQKIEFNFAVIIPAEEYSRFSLYENMIRKLALQLTVLEIENDYISNPEKQIVMGKLCKDIYTQLLDKNECYIPVDNWNLIIIELSSKNKRYPPKIRSWHVPTPLIDLYDIVEIRSDTSLNKIVKAINGIRCVKQISEFSKVDEGHVKVCLQHLYYHGMIEISDYFQDSNIYRITPKIGLILTEYAEEAVLSLARNSEEPEIDEAGLFDYYSKLSDKTIREFKLENPDFDNIVDLQKFIKYGTVRGLIRRIHKYYVKYNESVLRKTKTNPSDLETIRKASAYLNGKHNLDEIACVYYEHKSQEVEKPIEDACITFLK